MATPGQGPEQQGQLLGLETLITGVNGGGN